MNNAGHDEHDGLEERLGRLQPADLPRDLLRRLRAAGPPLRAKARGGKRLDALPPGCRGLGHSPTPDCWPPGC